MSAAWGVNAALILQPLVFLAADAMLHRCKHHLTMAQLLDEAEQLALRRDKAGPKQARALKAILDDIVGTLTAADELPARYPKPPTMINPPL